MTCENLRFSAKICVSPLLRFLGKGENLQKSAKISENLCLGGVVSEELRSDRLRADFSCPIQEEDLPTPGANSGGFGAH